MSGSVNREDVLSIEECVQLAGSGTVGRVVLSIDALPAALPVNYVLLDQSIWFFTGVGSKLDAAVRHAVVAFEVDHFDQKSETGWSVLAIGRSEEVTDPDVIETLKRSGLHPWANGDRHHLIRVVPERWSGRRLAKRT